VISNATTAGDGGAMEPLRQELVRRKARRYRRRWFLRWRRRRLLLRFVVTELSLAESTSEDWRELHQHEVDRVTARLEKNAKRLFR
jgi:hypothetical protein